MYAALPIRGLHSRIPLRELWECQDTGKKNGEHYPEGSIGYLNNMNNEIAPLPNTVEEIVSVMQGKNN